MGAMPGAMSRIRLLLPATRVGVGRGASLCTGALLCWSGLAKLSDLHLFGLQISAYRIIPEAWIPAATLAATSTELVLGIGLLACYARPWCALFATCALGALTVVVATAVARGLRIECGCFPIQETVSVSTIARDLGLILLAMTAWRLDRGSIGTGRLCLGVAVFAGLMICHLSGVSGPGAAIAITDGSGRMPQGGYVGVATGAALEWSQLRGRAGSVVVVLSPECDACRSSVRYLAEMADALSDASISLLPIWIAPPDPDVVAGADAGYWQDPSKLPPACTLRFPTTAVVDASGQVRKVVYGSLSRTVCDLLVELARDTLGSVSPG